MSAQEPHPRNRRYHSEVRTNQAAATRTRILEAAAHLFTDAGYTGTSLTDIAHAASVSVETVKLSGPKHRLLLDAFTHSFAGSDTITSLATLSSQIRRSPPRRTRRAATTPPRRHARTRRRTPLPRTHKNRPAPRNGRGYHLVHPVARRIQPARTRLRLEPTRLRNLAHTHHPPHLRARLTPVPRQVVGRVSSISKLGMVGLASPRWTSAGRFQAIASCGRTWL